MYFQPFPSAQNGNELEGGAKSEVAMSIFTSGKGVGFTKKIPKLVQRRKHQKEGNCGERRKWKAIKTWLNDGVLQRGEKNIKKRKKKKKKNQRLS